ncbi:hypothetical protein D3C85_1812960 [compost metagenome]
MIDVEVLGGVAVEVAPLGEAVSKDGESLVGMVDLEDSARLGQHEDPLGVHVDAHGRTEAGPEEA